MSIHDARPIDIQATAALRAALIASPPNWEAARIAALAGADVNARLLDPRSTTALQIAVWYGHTPTVNTLLEHGADPNARSEPYAPPLAVRFGHTATAAVLLEHGANPSAKDLSGHQLLTSAVRYGHTTVAALLLEHGADPNAPDVKGKTALMHASATITNRPEGAALVRLLIRHGADPSARDASGRTPLSIFVKTPRPDLLEALDAALADPDRSHQRHRLLDQLPADQRHRWLPRSTAASASVARYHWNRHP